MKVDNTIVGSFRGFRNLGLFGILFCLIGCSGGQIDEPDAPGDEPQPSTEQAIAFSAGLPEQQEITRSTPLEEELPVGEKTFKVWGFKNDAYTAGNYTSYQTVFPGYTVNWGANTAATTTSNTHDWEYVGINSQTIKYWDWSALAYRYFAVTKYEETKPATLLAGTIYKEAFNTDSDPATDDEYQFSMLADVSDVSALPFFSRMWFSTGNAVTYPGKQFGDPVVLEFIKPYARVRVMFTFTEETVDRTNIDAMSFKPAANTGIPQSGTVTVHYPLSGEKTREYYSLADEGARLTDITQDWYTSTDPSDAKKEKWYTVLPCEGQGAYTMTISIFGQELSAAVPAEFMQWKPGFEYTYVFKADIEGGLRLDNVWVGVTTMETKEEEYILYNW